MFQLVSSNGDFVVILSSKRIFFLWMVLAFNVSIGLFQRLFRSYPVIKKDFFISLLLFYHYFFYFRHYWPRNTNFELLMKNSASFSVKLPLLTRIPAKENNFAPACMIAFSITRCAGNKQIIFWPDLVAFLRQFDHFKLSVVSILHNSFWRESLKK